MSVIYINPYAFGVALDPDAAAYIAAVEAADSNTLEDAVKTAINTFVVGCKADGIWSAIKASCILAGARTLTGALVPLVGTAPTNNGPFVSGDYDRETGLLANGTTKWLNSNRNNNVDPQNSFHMCCYVSTVGGGTAVYMGAGPATNETGASNFGRSGTMFSRNRVSNASSASAVTTGLMGNSRANSSTFTNRFGGTSTTVTLTSQTPNNNLIGVFSSTDGALPASGRFAFYSIGESLAIDLLDSRVTTLINDFAAAIP